VLVAFNAPSVEKFAPAVLPGGTVIYDSTVVEHLPELAEGVRAVGVPFTALATELGTPRIKNVVALGALQAATAILPAASLEHALGDALARKPELAEANRAAFRRGAAAA
jgi:Pyruvate/2-oxoacid:ferredoxin oxidoreductase gamma subunit